MIVSLTNKIIAVKTKYKVGDTISWFCDTDYEIHTAKVEFVSYAGAGYPDINHEVETICCGEKRTLFIDEYGILNPDFM